MLMRSGLRLRTLGIDLAAQPKGTATCEMDWGSGDVKLVSRADDPALLAAARTVLASGGLVAIDAPFGWPRPFIAAIRRHAAHKPFGNAPTEQLRLRLTDQLVPGRPPLSVSSDRIAVVAFRAARLLGALGPIRRDGSDRVIEVYPAAALRRWRLERPGYKRNVDVRAWIAAEITAALPKLRIDAWDAELRTSADALDALVAALVGRAKLLGFVDPLPPEHAKVALTEGWIWLPQPDALRRLL
jgi:predicted nuclease with RNAse H fold